MVELLSPAGSPEALTAAVQSGADAVYLGFGAFNARLGAKNFTAEDFAAAVRYCHLRGVAVYLTLNTLLSDRELPEALEALRFANDVGADAVLVQDLGLLALAREAAPDLPIHASTQMSLFSPGGVRVAESLGMSRVVLARETSRQDIDAVCRTCSAEVEVFVHGALCMSYSGQCAMSALIGRRSGNRGACAQPCRLPYGVGAPCTGQTHPLSLKDANLSAHLPELGKMGVACLKIEGRMKRPEYVALVTSIYRRLLDEKRKPTREETAQLAQAFSRDGFTDGYYCDRHGADMFGTRPENAQVPEELFAAVRKTYASGEHRLQPVRLRCEVRRASAARLTATALRRGVPYTVSVEGAVPEEARQRALTAQKLSERLEKTGGTVFSVEAADVAVDDGVTLSAAAVNALRRAAWEQLSAELEKTPLCGAPHRAARQVPAPPPPSAGDGALRLTCSIARAEQLTPELACGVEAVYIPLELLDKLEIQPYADRTKIFAILPRVFRGKDEALFRETLCRHNALSGVVIGNLGHLPVVEGLALERRGDFGLNVYNGQALRLLGQLGLDSATLSFELRHQQIRDLPKYLPCEAILYGRLPLMLTENCPVNAAGQCRRSTPSYLTDRTGARFPTLCAYGCRCEIENSRVLYLADRPEYRACGLRYGRLRFTTESAEECLSVLRSYQTGDAAPPQELTRGLFYRGVE
ncbi:MAG: U32 family peptidase [Oscillospiraceae bacterium]|nr:U32 family peptidase [Oscillospiraceae bacterium]